METGVPDFISHYYEAERGPLQSVTSHEKEKAREIIRQITARKEGFSSNRPPQYIDWRMEVEEWLRKGFVAKGGNPKKATPHYFVLGECDWLLSWYKNGAVLKKRLCDIDPAQISFTYPDSMVSYQLNQYHIKGDNPLYKTSDYREYHGNVYLYKELHDVIARYGMPTGKTIEGKNTSHEMYIEVQVWGDL